MKQVKRRLNFLKLNIIFSEIFGFFVFFAEILKQVKRRLNFLKLNIIFAEIFGF